MNLFELKPHPYSEIFPPNESTFAELVASIKKLGRIRNAVIVYQDQILDGRSRLRACKIAKVEPKHIEFKGPDDAALELVWDLNYNRRHLDASQRSFAFAKYCKFADEGRPAGKHGAGTTLAEAAAKADVGKTTMQYAKKVVEQGTRKEQDDVKSGKSKVTTIAGRIRDREKAQGLVNEQVVDDMLFPVPVGGRVYFARREEARGILQQLRAAKATIQALDPRDPMWCEVNLNGLLGDLESALSRFRKSIPAYVCPDCNGVNPKGCDCCKERGVISKFAWSRVDDKIKLARKKAIEQKA